VRVPIYIIKKDAGAHPRLIGLLVEIERDTLIARATSDALDLCGVPGILSSRAGKSSRAIWKNCLTNFEEAKRRIYYLNPGKKR
jgi:hypothetical protein